MKLYYITKTKPKDDKTYMYVSAVTYRTSSFSWKFLFVTIYNCDTTVFFQVQNVFPLRDGKVRTDSPKWTMQMINTLFYWDFYQKERLLITVTGLCWHPDAQSALFPRSEDQVLYAFILIESELRTNYDQSSD